MAAVEYPETGHDWCAAVEDDSWWFRHRSAVIAAALRRFPPPASTPLYDVGGGNGVVAAALHREGFRTVVVEPGAAGARRARARGLEAIHASLETAGFAPGTLGSIGLFDVLEHIEDAAGFLRRAHALLEPGGRLYLTVPAYGALWSDEDVFAHHFRRYTARSLRRELLAAGFHVELATYFFAFLPLPILLFRSLPYRLGRSRPFTESGVQADHAAPRGVFGALVRGALAAERMMARVFGGVPFGASVIAVARVPSGPPADARAPVRQA